MNVIEIDGASNNGVDAIRELRNTVGFMPSSGKFKIYIIDEVHMLSTSAFNALLKTLEEPPAHVVFIFATTEAQKIPITILSRCQRFDFRRIPTRQIAERLQLICKSEGIQAETEALWTIARQAEGALRDSQSLLDQAITFCDGNITQEKVIQVLGLTDRVLLFETLNALVSRDAQAAMNVIEKIYASGFDASVYVQDLLEHLRHLLIVKLNPDDNAAIVDLPESEIKELLQIGDQLSSEDIHLLFDMTLKGANDLVRTQNPRIVLEMLLLRMTQAPRIVELSKLFNGSVTVTSKDSSAVNSTRNSTGSSTLTPKTTTTKSKDPSPRETAPQPVNIFDAVKDAQANWLLLVDKIKSVQPSLGARLEFVSLIEFTPSVARLGTKDPMIQTQLNEKTNLLKIQSFIKTYWNKSVDVTVEAAKSDAAPSPKDLTIQKEKKSQEDLRTAVENHPLVKKTQDTFKTKITSIKERS